MEIHYRSPKHKKLIENEKKLRQTYGDRNSKEILSCINELEAAESLDAIPPFIRPHPLTSKILIYSVDVEHPFRLLFVPHGKYDTNTPLTTITAIEIVELSMDTHDKKFNGNNY